MKFIEIELWFYVMIVQVHLSDIWKEKYEEWLDIEVFQMPRDWDKILRSPSAYLEVKAMDY